MIAIVILSGGDAGQSSHPSPICGVLGPSGVLEPRGKPLITVPWWHGNGDSKQIPTDLGG